jgi:K+/H+ antiporter YhaU regulatory subunit KhtT
MIGTCQNRNRYGLDIVEIRRCHDVLLAPKADEKRSRGSLWCLGPTN